MAAKPQPYQGFGNMLTEALKRLAIQRTMKAVQDDLAEELSYAPRTIYAWRNGEHLPPSEAIETMIRIFVQKGAVDQKWVNEFLKKGEYGPVEAVIALNQELFGQINDLNLGLNSHLVETNQEKTTNSTEEFSSRNNFFVATLINWSNDFFRWSEAPEHLRSNWTGKVMHILTVTTSRITSGGFFAISTGGLLILVNARLLMPILQWPLEDVSARWWACLSYSLATLLIPVWVAWVTPPDQPGLFSLETNRQHFIFWILKFAGALVGFWVFSVLVIVSTLVLYYFYISPLPGVVRAVLTPIPLFFSYVVARRIPLDRYKMFSGTLQPHPADRLFLGVFIVAGPGIAWFIYFSYGFLADRSVAPLVLMSLLNVIALWKYRKQDRRLISDRNFILILGLLFPTAILIYAYFLAPNFSPFSFDELQQIVIASIYFLGWTLIGATVIVRNPPVLTLAGASSFLSLLIIAYLIVVTDRLIGIGFISIISLIWAAWGRKRFRSYFWVHSSIWMMILATGVALYLWVSDLIPLWVNSLGFLAICTILIMWAYRIPNNRP